MTTLFRFDRGSIDSHFDSNGFLHVEGHAAKTGVLVYINPDGTKRRELVSHDTLFNNDSLQSLIGLPVTNDHPSELVTPENYKKYASGSVTANKRTDNTLSVSLSINNDEAITSIKQGKKQLSCGYAVELDHTPGTWQGKNYDAIQTKRIYNHLAIVSSARAGNECRLNLDAAEEVEETTRVKTMADIKLPSGLTVNVDDASVATAIQGEFNNMQVNVDGLNKTVEDQKTNISEVQANLDAKTEELKQRNDADLVTPVINTIEKCKRLDSDFEHNLNGVIKSEIHMKRDVLVKSKINIDGKDDAYIDARFDIALEQHQDQIIAKQRDTGINTDSNNEPVLTGREKFMAEQVKAGS